MAIKRQKINRKVDLTIKDGKVVDLPPDWSFTIKCEHHGDVKFNFDRYREHGRSDLATHIRDALWTLRHEVVGLTLLEYEKRGVRQFWRFLDYLENNGSKITRLKQIDNAVIKQYLAWLPMQIAMEGKNKGKFISLLTQKASYGQLRTLLINRQKRVPDCVDPDLSLPTNAFASDVRISEKRVPYSHGEQKRITDALNSDLKLIHEKRYEYRFTTYQVMAVHLLILAMMTGKNLQCLLELTRDALQSHPLEDREILITHKRRGYRSHVTSYRKADTDKSKEGISTIPQGVAEHFRFLCEFTEPLVSEASPDDRNFVMLCRIQRYARAGQVARWDADSAYEAVTAFAKRHALLDDLDKPLKLNIARMRPTMATELYRRTRDIRYVQKALGHVNATTTARHYTDSPLEAERDHAIVLDSMVSRFAKMEINGQVLLAADGLIPLHEVKDILSGGYNTGIARCRNPFRENESVCQKFFRCFKCPSMCVFEDDLWRLFSFYYRVLSERSKINPEHWLKTYAPIIRKIDVEIATQFPSEKVESSRLKARETPHPTWR